MSKPHPWAALAMLLLASCNQPDPDVCSSFLPRVPTNGATPGDVALNASACVEHWAARLAAGDDSAAAVVQAAMGACEEGIADANEGDPQGAEQRLARLERLAYFRAVQRRAGKCGAPDIGALPV